MASEEIPDVAVSETASLTAIVGFSALALLLFALFAFAVWLRRKRERDGIYRKYKLPGDAGGIRR